MTFKHSIITPALVQAVLARRLYVDSYDHGLEHWQRVERNGLFLAEQELADLKVVSLFALFHDAQRMDDFADPDHGPRAAELVLDFYRQDLLEISEEACRLLAFACRHHTDTRFHENSTIQCCWDADRLDLTRIGVWPDSMFLNTSTAKAIADSMNYFELDTYDHPVNRIWE